MSEVQVMPRHGRTAARGYDAQHRRDTARLKAAMRDGQPCARGGEPLYRWQLTLPPHHPMAIDGDHGTARALGGTTTDTLSCAHHNRQHGARLGNRLRAGQTGRPARQPPPATTQWINHGDP